MPEDKVLHFVAGFAIAYLFGLCPENWVKVMGLTVGISVGAAKEWIYDKRHPLYHTVDPKDFQATALGSLVGFAIRW